MFYILGAIVFLSALPLYLGSLFNSSSHRTNSCTIPYTIAIIADMHGIGRKELRFSNHVKAFRQNIIDLAGGDLEEFRIWPPVYARRCNVYKGQTPGSIEPSKVRGTNIAHKDIWDYFIRNSAACVILIFEYDVFTALPTSHVESIKALKHMVITNQPELLYLGYCYKNQQLNPLKPGAPAPYCLHAYALNLNGARKVVEATKGP